MAGSMCVRRRRCTRSGNRKADSDRFPDRPFAQGLAHPYRFRTRHTLDPLAPIPHRRDDVAYVSGGALAAPAAAARKEHDAIREVVDAYRASCERLDAASAATLWRGVDTRALSRAFSTLSSQTLTFDQCAIDVEGARATAVCDGSLSYVRRVGDQTPQSRRLTWSFDFERAADRWMISGVTAR
jgi:hypothetical protein